MEDQVVLDGAAGIRSIPDTDQTATFSKIVNKSKTRYIFYAGDPGEFNKGLSMIEYRNGLTFIRRGVITQVDNFSYWDRDQDDRTDMPAQRHPSQNRKHEVRQTLYASDIVDFVKRLYGSVGVVEVGHGLEVAPQLMAETARLLLPAVPGTNAELVRHIKQYVFENDIDENSLVHQVANEILAACAQAQMYGRAYLGSMKSEMEMHRVGKDGIAALDDSAKRWIKILGFALGDYEVDTQNIQMAQAHNAAPAPVIVQSSTSPADIAAAVKAAMEMFSKEQNDRAQLLAEYQAGPQSFVNEHKEALPPPVNQTDQLSSGNAIADAIIAAEKKKK